MDVFAICGTLFGAVHSTVFGVLQIAACVPTRFKRCLQLLQLPATALPVTAPEHGPEAAPRA